ncbi:diguanylate cyclase domain-containing protein [Fusibacter ferrireducens]|uniref:Diguanylate cyclase n=1 Tax=Fusibacter ferrireducens TaxID=2785058 RepID=A0ABR9ZQL4_9FIRM|nr:diguanylate cyclase [Fusibacter ferrireducens]MBF4692724.1 diguanylate cyclase [Fusibacter ferrireducens]
MKSHLKKIIYSILILVILLFTLFFITLLMQKNFFFYDYALYGALLVVLALTLSLGLIPGLLICAIVIFGYGSVVFFQMITGTSQIWTLNYLWFIAYPLTTFFAGQLSENVRMANEQCTKCDKMTDRIVTIDEITGFGNGREFLRDLDGEMARAKRHKIPLTIGVLEIQYFEELITIYGRDNTKKIYKVIAEALNRATRVEDLRFRIDEDMLGLILPHTTIENAQVVKMRLKENLSKLEIEDESSLGRYNIELKVGLLAYRDDILNPMEFKALAVKELEYDV